MQSVLSSTDCSREQGVLGSKEFKGATCVEEHRIPGSKMFMGVKCSGEQSKSLQSVLESKVCVSLPNRRVPKCQLISKCVFGAIISTKKTTKFFKEFLP